MHIIFNKYKNITLNCVLSIHLLIVRFSKTIVYPFNIVYALYVKILEKLNCMDCVSLHTFYLKQISISI